MRLPGAPRRRRRRGGAAPARRQHARHQQRGELHGRHVVGERAAQAQRDPAFHLTIERGALFRGTEEEPRRTKSMAGKGGKRLIASKIAAGMDKQKKAPITRSGLQAWSNKEVKHLQGVNERLLKRIVELKGTVKTSNSKIDPVTLDDSLNQFVEQYLGSEDGNCWFDTVDCYDRSCDDKFTCPWLTHEKGSLAGVSVNGRIYAFGGGDGTECFSDVEMFDLAQGKWIKNQPMLEKLDGLCHTVLQRFALAGVAQNGLIYAFGGFNGVQYLSSAERLDPLEPNWKMLPKMSAGRGCHTLTVLDEKIFSIGGYDIGDKAMVTTVEVYEPRMPSWRMVEPMNYTRGYHSSAVLSGSIFTFGGVKGEADIILDAVLSIAPVPEARPSDVNADEGSDGNGKDLSVPDKNAGSGVNADFGATTEVSPQPIETSDETEVTKVESGGDKVLVGEPNEGTQIIVKVQRQQTSSAPYNPFSAIKLAPTDSGAQTSAPVPEAQPSDVNADEGINGNGKDLSVPDKNAGSGVNTDFGATTEASPQPVETSGKAEFTEDVSGGDKVLVGEPNEGTQSQQTSSAPSKDTLIDCGGRFGGSKKRYCVAGGLHGFGLLAMKIAIIMVFVFILAQPARGNRFDFFGATPYTLHEWDITKSYKDFHDGSFRSAILENGYKVNGLHVTPWAQSPLANGLNVMSWPSSISEKPKAWIAVNVVASGLDGERVTLALRVDNLYVIAFANKRDDWFCFSTQQSQLPCKNFLPFTNSYGDDGLMSPDLRAEGKPEKKEDPDDRPRRDLCSLDLGEAAATSAMLRLSNMDVKSDMEATRVALRTMIALICEAQRFKRVFQPILTAWPGPTRLQDVQCVWSWGDISCCMLRYNLKGTFAADTGLPIRMRNNGILTYEDAYELIDLLQFPYRCIKTNDWRQIFEAATPPSPPPL